MSKIVSYHRIAVTCRVESSFGLKLTVQVFSESLRLSWRHISAPLFFSPRPSPLRPTPSPPSLCSLLATLSFFMLWHQTTTHCTVCSLLKVSMAIKTGSAPYSNRTGNQRHFGPICALWSDIMEFLGLESERGLALRIAVVPSGKDNIIRALRRHIRAPQAQQLEWSSDRVTDTQRGGGSGNRITEK